MKKVLCYGDSNTFGFNPENGSRFNSEIRWSGILKNKLQNKFEVVEEGLNNRAGFCKSSDDFQYNGASHVLELIKNNFDDVEYLILAIGTNDYQFRFDMDEENIENKLNEIARIAKDKNIKIIFLSPVILKKEILNSWFNNLFNNESIIKSQKFASFYKKLAKKLDLIYVDLNEIVKPSLIDGLHYDENSHKLIAQKLIEILH